MAVIEDLKGEMAYKRVDVEVLIDNIRRMKPRSILYKALEDKWLI